MSDKKYYNREEAAKYLGLGVSTLACWASTGRQELPYSKMGRMVRYRKEDLDKFMEKGIQKKEVEVIDPKPSNISTPKETSQEAKDLVIVSEALLNLKKLIENHNKLDACNSILTPHNVERHAKVLQACYRQLVATVKGDETTAEIWAHKIKLMTVAR